jgi:hypothetical protein
MEIREYQMKYEVGDIVQIKSAKWLNSQNKDDQGNIYLFSKNFLVTSAMLVYAGKKAKITSVNISGNLMYYTIDIDNEEWSWVDEMFEESNTPSGHDVDIAIRKLEECSNLRGDICIDEYTQKTVSVDKNIRTLIDYINSIRGFVVL